MEVYRCLTHLKHSYTEQLLVQTNDQWAEAEAPLTSYADSDPTTRVLRFAKPYCT